MFNGHGRELWQFFFSFHFCGCEWLVGFTFLNHVFSLKIPLLFRLSFGVFNLSFPLLGELI